METAYATSPFFTAVCVLANGDLDTPLAICHADNDYLEHWAADNNVPYKSLKELASKEETRKAAVKSMVSAGKEAGLTSLELRIKDCAIITHVEWLPGNGMTATMKLDRKKIYSMHEEEMHAMYKRSGVEVSK